LKGGGGCSDFTGMWVEGRGNDSHECRERTGGGGAQMERPQIKRFNVSV